MRRSIAIPALALAALAIVLVALRVSGAREEPVAPSPAAAAEPAETPQALAEPTAPAGAGEERRPAAATTDRPARASEAQVQSAILRARGRPIVLTGSVTDGRGRSVFDSEDCRVTVVTATGERREVRGPRPFFFEGLEPGNAAVTCEVPGFRTASREIELSAAEPVHRETFVLEPLWQIAVRLVSPDGQSLLRAIPREDLDLWACLDLAATKEAPGARIEARRDGLVVRSSAGSWLDRAGLDGPSLAELPTDCAGLMTVLAEPPVHLSVAVRGVVLATQPVDTYVETLSLAVPVDRLIGLYGSVQCRVVDARTGAPFEQAWVQLSGSASRVQADADGRARFERLLPGRQLVMAFAPDSAYDGRETTLEPGEDADLGTIALEPAATVKGRFLGPDGRSVAAQGYLIPYSNDDPLDWSRPYLWLDVRAAENSWFLAAVCARKYLVHVGSMHPNEVPVWRSIPRVVDWTAEPPGELAIPVVQGVGLTLRLAGTDEAGLEYWVVTADGLPCERGTLARSGPALVRLAPGSYRLLVRRAGATVREIPFALGSEPQTLDVGP